MFGYYFLFAMVFSNFGENLRCVSFFWFSFYVIFLSLEWYDVIWCVLRNAMTLTTVCLVMKGVVFQLCTESQAAGAEDLSKSSILGISLPWAGWIFFSFYYSFKESVASFTSVFLIQSFSLLLILGEMQSILHSPLGNVLLSSGVWILEAWCFPPMVGCHKHSWCPCLGCGIGKNDHTC